MTGTGNPPASRPLRRLRADRGDVGERLDRTLVRHLADLGASRTRVRTWIEAGRVRHNGVAAERPGRRLGLGDLIEVELPPPPPPRPAPPAWNLPVSVLYEDDHFLAVDKPAGLVVHPTAGRRDGTLLNALLADPERFADGRPRLVQRLDRDTSGLLLVAKSAAAHAGLARSLAARDAEKTYLAVVYGVPKQAKGRIALCIHRDPEEPRRRVASRSQGRAAATRWEVLDAIPGSAAAALIACRLETGRTHQIRVHLAALGHPLVGDPLYGEPRHRGIADPGLAAACRGFPRQALHAWRLAFPHPETRRTVELEAPPPADLAALLRACSLSVS